MRKLLLIISVFIICVSCAPATFAEQAYSDEKCSEWAYYYIKDAESPLYEITYKDKSYFAFDETEKANIMKKLDGKKYTILRSKGLGENQPDMMWETTMNPETRRLIKVTPDDAEKTQEMFDLLLGDNLAGRKEHIAEVGHNFIDLTDVS